MKFSEKSTDILIENLCLTDYTIVTEEISKLESEIERLHSIIKEAREYINKISSEPNVFWHYAIDGNCKKWLLKILDKENNNENN